MNPIVPLSLLAAVPGEARPPARDEVYAEIARDYIDAWDRLDPSALDAVLSPAVRGHVNGRTFEGVDIVKARIAAHRQAYAPSSFTLEDLVVSGDKAVVRWVFRGTHSGPLGKLPATGREVTVTGMNLLRFEDGWIVEMWVNADDLGELTQLGVVSAP
jgi:predicted ester cyclase